MKKKFSGAVAAAVLGIGMGSPGLIRAEPVGAFGTPAPIKTLDEDANALAASQARSDRTDLDMMNHIRREIALDRSLSIDAHSVKVIVQKRKVMLIGLVDSETEKLNVESKAVEAAGSTNVSSQLDVKMN